MRQPKKSVFAAAAVPTRRRASPHESGADDEGNCVGTVCAFSCNIVASEIDVGASSLRLFMNAAQPPCDTSQRATYDTTMEKFKTPVPVRCPSAQGGSMTIGVVGVCARTTCHTFYREVARLTHTSSASPYSQEQFHTLVDPMSKLHVALVLETKTDESTWTQRLSIDRSTNFELITAKVQSRERGVFFFARAKTTKRERKMLDKSSKPISTSKKPGPVVAEQDEASTSKHIPKPISTMTGANADTVETAFAISSDETTQRRRVIGQVAKSSGSEIVNSSEAPKSAFEQSKIKDPVVFPSFRRSAFGAIGAPQKFIVDSRNAGFIAAVRQNK